MIGRIAGKNELGLYAVCWTLVTIVTEVSAALIATPYTVFGPQMGKAERRHYLGSMLVQQIVLSLVLACLTLAGMAFASSRGASGALVNAVTIAAVSIVFISLREFARRVCFAELRVVSAILLDLAACFGQMIGLTLLWYFGWLSAPAIYGLLGCLSMAIAFTWIFLNRFNVRLDRGSWIRGLRHNWNFRSGYSQAESYGPLARTCILGFSLCFTARRSLAPGRPATPLLRSAIRSCWAWVTMSGQNFRMSTQVMACLACGATHIARASVLQHCCYRWFSFCLFCGQYRDENVR